MWTLWFAFSYQGIYNNINSFIYYKGALKATLQNRYIKSTKQDKNEYKLNLKDDIKIEVKRRNIPNAENQYRTINKRLKAMTPKDIEMLLH